MGLKIAWPTECAYAVAPDVAGIVGAVTRSEQTIIMQSLLTFVLAILVVIAATHVV